MASASVREYIWLDDWPVAVLDGSATPTNPTLLWVHADHLKRPEMMTTAAKAVVWKALYEPFGAVHSVTGAAALTMRFPGQWFQLEAGLHYNWHRHYDPTTGRYTQPDPLTISDYGVGPSAYAYAWNSPSMVTDFDGRNPAIGISLMCLRFPQLCAGIGASAVASATQKALQSVGKVRGMLREQGPC